MEDKIYLIFRPVCRERGIPKEILTRKPQALNSLSGDYCRISLEPGWQRNMASNTSILLLSAMASETGMWGIFSHFSLFLGKKGKEVRRGAAEGGVPSFPSEMRSGGLLPASRALKWNVRMADHRGQRKMIFSSLRFPRPGPLLWGLLLLTGNRSRRLLCFCSVPHTHTHVLGVYGHTYAHIQTLHHLSIP